MVHCNRQQQKTTTTSKTLSPQALSNRISLLVVRTRAIARLKLFAIEAWFVGVCVCANLRPAMLPATMKALVKERTGPSYEYKDVPLPVPQGDELLVKVRKVALCGSDISLYQWNNG